LRACGFGVTFDWDPGTARLNGPILGGLGWDEKLLEIEKGCTQMVWWYIDCGPTPAASMLVITPSFTFAIVPSQYLMLSTAQEFS
jgi:hypothetical protein